MTAIENHMISREDKLTDAQLEAKLIKMHRVVGFLEYAQGMIAELGLDQQLAVAVQNSLNASLNRLFDAQDEAASRPAFHVPPPKDDFDYFGYAVDLLKGQKK
jgi:hypothetical protein